MPVVLCATVGRIEEVVNPGVVKWSMFLVRPSCYETVICIRLSRSLLKKYTFLVVF